jgi:hypothetical protein
MARQEQHIVKGEGFAERGSGNEGQMANSKNAAGGEAAKAPGGEFS